MKWEITPTFFVSYKKKYNVGRSLLSRSRNPYPYWYTTKIRNLFQSTKLLGNFFYYLFSFEIRNIKTLYLSLFYKPIKTIYYVKQKL